MSWKELYDRYDEFKDKTLEELTDSMGEWWAYVFYTTKEDIRIGKWRRPIPPSSDDSTVKDEENDEGGCKDSCPIR